MDSKHFSDSRFFWCLIITVIIGGLIYLLRPILTPFLLAAAIAYICNPLVTWLADRKIPRTLSTIFVMLMTISIFTAMILIMLPLFEKEISRLIERIPFFFGFNQESFYPLAGG